MAVNNYYTSLRHRWTHTNGQTFEWTKNGVLTGNDVKVVSSQPAELRNASHPLPYSRTLLKYSPFVGRISFYGLGVIKESVYEGTLSQDPGEYFASLPALPVNASDNKARERFAKNALDAKAQGLVILGEGAESARTLAKAGHAIRIALNKQYRTRYFEKKLKDYSRIRSSLSKDTSSRRQALSSIANGLSDNWLEFVYGIQPLIADVADVTEAIANRRAASIKIKGTDIVIKSDSATHVGQDAYIENVVSNLIKRDFSHLVSYGALFKDESPPSVAARLGLSLTDVVPAIYELVPYSFLVDYFSNIGGIVNSVAASAVAVSGLYRSEMSRTLFTVVKSPANPAYASQSGSFSGSYESVVFSRTVSGISLIPSFRIKTPGSQQLFNTAALLVNKFTNSRRNLTIL